LALHRAWRALGGRGRDLRRPAHQRRRPAGSRGVRQHRAGL